jgi:hypothetical protein
LRIAEIQALPQSAVGLVEVAGVWPIAETSRFVEPNRRRFTPAPNLTPFAAFAHAPGQTDRSSPG